MTKKTMDDKIKFEKKIATIDEKGNLKEFDATKLKQLKKSRDLNLADLNIGFYILTPLILGVFLGYFFDKWLRTKHLFTFWLLMLGAVAGFYNLLKYLKDE